MRFPQIVVILTVFVLVLGFGCPPQQAFVSLSNIDSDTITGFWIRPSNTSDWGPLRLTPVLFSGTSVKITISPGVWDFRVEDDGLSQGEKLNISVSQGQEVRLIWTATGIAVAKSQTMAAAQ